MKKSAKKVGDKPWDKKLWLIVLAFIVCLALYSVTSKSNTSDEIDPEECQDADLTLENACLDQGKIRLAISCSQKSFNGITARVIGDLSIMPFKYFKTVKSNEEGIFIIDYNKEVIGTLKRIEIKPLLNIDRTVFYCSSDHKINIEGELDECH